MAVALEVSGVSKAVLLLPPHAYSLARRLAVFDVMTAEGHAQERPLSREESSPRIVVEG